MALIEIGRVCIKKYGRDAGRRAVITAVMENGFVKVLTADRNKKERRCNTRHLEILKEVVDIKDKAQVNRALGMAGAG